MVTEAWSRWGVRTLWCSRAGVRRAIEPRDESRIEKSLNSLSHLVSLRAHLDPELPEPVVVLGEQTKDFFAHLVSPIR